MFYFFEIDKDADTPLNRARRRWDRQNLRKAVLAIGAVVLVAVAAVFLIKRSMRPAADEESLLLTQGLEAVGRVVIRPGVQPPDISYQFVAGSQGVSAPVSLQSAPLILLENGMPLENGDEFTVRYLPRDPTVSLMDFSRPTSRQLGVYQLRAGEKHAALHPAEAPDRVSCLVKIAYELQGISGLADVYFQDVSEEKNAGHNAGSFQRLVQAAGFREKVEAGCR